MGGGDGSASSSRSLRCQSKPGLRIVILTLGTRGDVQPYIALGHALRDAGHTPVICASSDFKEFVEGAPGGSGLGPHAPPPHPHPTRGRRVRHRIRA